MLGSLVQGFSIYDIGVGHDQFEKKRVQYRVRSIRMFHVLCHLLRKIG